MICGVGGRRGACRRQLLAASSVTSYARIYVVINLGVFHNSQMHHWHSHLLASSFIFISLHCTRFLLRDAHTLIARFVLWPWLGVRPAVRPSVCHMPAYFETTERIEVVFGTEATLIRVPTKIRALLSGTLSETLNLAGFPALSPRCVDHLKCCLHSSTIASLSLITLSARLRSQHFQRDTASRRLALGRDNSGIEKSLMAIQECNWCWAPVRETTRWCLQTERTIHNKQTCQSGSSQKSIRFHEMMRRTWSN